MVVKKYTDSDKELIASWYKFYNLNPQDLENIPKDSTFIIEKDGNPIVIGSLYFTICGNYATGSDVVGNPEFKGEVRAEAVEKLIKTAEVMAKELGYRYFVFSTVQEKLKDKYIAYGYNQYSKAFIFCKQIN